MAKDNHNILGVHVTDRLKNVAGVQKLFTDFGDSIKTRLGMHELGIGNPSSPNGLVILEMVGTDARAKDLAKQLAAIPGIEVQHMVFKHD